MLSVKDVAQLLQVSEKTIYRWLNDDKIPHQRAGEQYRFSQHEVIAWAESQGRGVDPKSLCEPEVEYLPSLSEAIGEGGIYYRLDGRGPEDVIEEIVSIMRLPPDVSRQYVRDALLARESMASTGIGDGIAIPHMRHPLPQVGTPLVSLCFLAEAMEWGAIDGKPVRIVFLPCCPNMRTHLHLLARISHAAKCESWRRLLDQESKRKEILRELEAIEARIDSDTTR